MHVDGLLQLILNGVYEKWKVVKDNTYFEKRARRAPRLPTGKTRSSQFAAAGAGALGALNALIRFGTERGDRSDNSPVFTLSSLDPPLLRLRYNATAGKIPFPIHTGSYSSFSVCALIY